MVWTCDAKARRAHSEKVLMTDILERRKDDQGGGKMPAIETWTLGVAT